MKCTMDNGSISKSAKKRIVILGGGFGGVYAALHLERLLARAPEVEICLVSRDNFFLFTPMLHEIAASDLEITNKRMLRVVLVHPGAVILPELGESLGRYAQKVLAQRGVEIRLNTRVTSMTKNEVCLKDSPPIRSSTLIWTAGTVPNPLLASLPCQKEGGRVLVNEFLQIPGWPEVWAVGDCAFVPDNNRPGKSHPPTAQHAIREGRVAAQNIALALAGRRLKPFSFKTIGLLASIGRRTGVARILVFNFSGFFAWWLWRTIYLSKLPGLDKKVRVAFDWTLDLLFPKDVCAVHDLTYRRDLHRSDQRTHTVGNNGDHQPGARQLVYSSMKNGLRDSSRWEANQMEAQTQRMG